MPEKTEDLQQEGHSVTEPIASNKCKKILRLFRSVRKKEVKNRKTRNDSEKKRRKDKRQKCRDAEERKEIFKKNMENSWVDLPNTLRRKRESISDVILSEFQDSASSEPENSKSSSLGNLTKKWKEKSCDLSSDNGEPTCEYFRQKKEEELDSESLNRTTKEELVKLEKFAGRKKKKNLTSEIVFEKSEKGGQVSLEKIRKLSEDEYEPTRKPGNERKVVRTTDSYDLKAAVDEINSLFHDLIAENGGQSGSATSSDSGNSESFVNLTIPSPERADDVTGRNEYGRGTENGMKRCNSSDSLLNGSSASASWASDLSQQEMALERNKDEGSDVQKECGGGVLDENSELANGSPVIEARPRDSASPERKSCCKETLELLSRITGKEVKEEAENAFKSFINEGTQYSDLMIPLPAKSAESLLNGHFKGDDSVSLSKERQEERQLEVKIIYQELDFIKSENDDKVDGLLKSGEEPSKVSEIRSSERKPEKPSESEAVPAPPSSLSEVQKAKKKSAEAIAKELSSQVFNRKSQPEEESSEKKNVLTISISGPSGSEGEEANVTLAGTFGAGEEKDENWDVGGKAEWTGVSLQYFSVADWRKAVALGCKRGISSAVMETIVEEPETDTSTKLTVEEILRRFEELGNKHFNEKLCMTDDERTATLKQIHQTLKCLEEKVHSFRNWSESNFQHQQYLDSSRVNESSSGGWSGRGMSQRPAHSLPARGPNESEEVTQTSVNDGKHSLLQFAIHHFRQSPEKFEMLKTSDGSISGSLKVIESKNKKNKEKGKGGSKDSSEWTWKEQVDLVKFTAKPIEQSLLQLDPELSDLAVECFLCLMRYMGDLPMPTDVSEVKCVYTILMHCHKYEQLRDEVYCQLMKQTTNNKSIQQESCQRGWRLFSIVAAYFSSSDTLKPFLFKYLETAAYDKRRAYHGTAMVCLQNLRKTFKYGGRKNVPSVEEITAISAGRNSKRQIYRLPGGTEKVVNTKSTTVVQDVIEELCVMINVVNPQEMEEFSVYCIVEGDTFTMPLAREEYILDVTTELHKNHQVFYLIFCRSVWYFPLRLDSQLYIEVVFNQIAPDYLEGLLLILPGESLEQEIIYDISKIAALLHRAADMTEVPTMKETKFLLPKPALSVRDVKPSQWVNMVQSSWQDCENLTTIQAKAQVLEALSKWPLFGSSFFAVKKVPEPKDRTDHILALNRNGVHFIDLMTHETLLHYPFSEVISTRKVKSEDGTLFLDMKCGNLMQQRITRLQTDQAHEISRLIRQYITMQQRMGTNQM